MLAKQYLSSGVRLSGMLQLKELQKYEITKITIKSLIIHNNTKSTTRIIISDTEYGRKQIYHFGIVTLRDRNWVYRLITAEATLLVRIPDTP